jgi:hypothetical protein
VLGQPEPLGGPFPGVFHCGLRRSFQQDGDHGAQRQDREERADQNEQDDRDGHLQQQSGELQHPLHGLGRGPQAVTHQLHIVGHAGPVQVIDPGRPVHQVHQLATEAHLLPLRQPGEIQVAEVAEHELGDERDGGEHRHDQRGSGSAGQHVVGQVAQRQGGQGRGDVEGDREHRRAGQPYGVDA